MNIQLSLITKWFEVTKAGIKTEDYRDINDYWIKRLVKDPIYPLDKCEFKHFDINTMTLGYPKSTDTSRIAKFKHAGIEIRTGNPEWGAEPNKLYFVIKHGDRL
jgi:hypothetical protein